MIQPFDAIHPAFLEVPSRGSRWRRPRGLGTLLQANTSSSPCTTPRLGSSLASFGANLVPDVFQPRFEFEMLGLSWELGGEAARHRGADQLRDVHLSWPSSSARDPPETKLSPSSCVPSPLAHPLQSLRSGRPDCRLLECRDAHLNLPPGPRHPQHMQCLCIHTNLGARFVGPCSHERRGHPSPLPVVLRKLPPLTSRGQMNSKAKGRCATLSDHI